MRFLKALTKKLLSIIEFFLQKIILRILLFFLYILVFPIGRFLLLFDFKRKKESYFEDFEIEKERDFYYWQS
ncbi:MAG: hypothetical protein C0601_02270 [Candidatus Muiribacterium halophilum]|uniref:Uncharacterized protein n=1 Tax=Muiribacterium halophilum TaxID=2053465 RepID=A0A2N5ZKS7_MUIH1|nr:MAG: hypothetical protein C0601_02270 [Candidatus Muirbacterium halophilum]